MKLTIQLKLAIESAIGAALARIQPENGFQTAVCRSFRGRAIPDDGGQMPEIQFWTGDFGSDDDPSGTLAIAFGVRSGSFEATRAAAYALESDIRNAVLGGGSEREIRLSVEGSGEAAVLVGYAAGDIDTNHYETTGNVTGVAIFELAIFRPHTAGPISDGEEN